MHRIICATLLALAIPAHSAEMIAKNGKDWIRVSDKQCTNTKALSHVPEPLRDQFKSAMVQYEGKLYRACWIATGEGVVLVYEDSDRGLIPFSAFEPAAGV